MQNLLFQNQDDQPVLTKSDMDDIYAQCMVSTKTHAAFFFPEIFYSPFNPLHDQMIELIDSGAPKIAIAAPRGIGKTSLVMNGVVSRHLLFQTKKFIAYLSNSATSAELQSENLKFELLANPLIRKVFGSIKTDKLNEVDYEERFSKLAWVSNGGVLVYPRGYGQQIRGVLYHAHRPDLIIIDDYEEKDNIASEEQRKKLKERFHSDVMKCISRYDKDYQFIYIDTLKHEDSLLQDLLDSKDWESLRLEVCDDNYKSNAPTFMTDEEIAKDVQEHREKGILDVFFREMRNIPISKEDAVFKEDRFKYFIDCKDHLLVRSKKDGVKDEKIPMSKLTTVVIIDPAKTVKVQSDYSAIVGISVDRETQKIFVRDIIAEMLYPDQIYSKAFDMVRRLHASMLAPEVTTLHEFIIQPIKNQMKIDNLNVLLEELKAVGKKEDRIATLAPFYRQGFIYHNADNCNVLESQLLSFPRSKRDDAMDAVAYIVKLMEQCSIYFDPPDFEDDEAYYAELENDKALQFESRV